MRKKLKWIIIIGSTGLLVTLTLSIWAFFSLISFGKDKILSLNLNDQAQIIESQVRSFSGLKPLECWNKIQSLSQIELLLEKPIASTFDQLVSACLSGRAPNCTDLDCEKTDSKNEPPLDKEII
jgi:hypothetical protein